MDDSEDEGESGAPGPGPAAGGGPAFGGLGSEIREHWSDLVEDAEATAAEFQEAGWETLVLHPGDVTVTSMERFGIDVLVPDDEFERVESWVESGSFDAYDVYRAETGIVFVLIVMKDEADERALCIPAYYRFDDLSTLLDGAREHGAIFTYVRNLQEEFVTFTHHQPALFLPDPEDEGETGDVGATADPTDGE